MAKKVTKILKFQITGGKAVPGQQLGPALGQAGINIGEFVSRFNKETADRMGEMVPVVVSVYEDRTYGMAYKLPPVADLIKSAIKLEKGSGTNLTKKVGKISKAQIKAIAEKKMPDMNCHSLESAMKMVEGSCQAMGVEVVG